VYLLLAILGGSRCKASLVAWLVWVVLLSAWYRICIVELFDRLSLFFYETDTRISLKKSLGRAIGNRGDGMLILE
jgi:hypothetical protein